MILFKFFTNFLLYTLIKYSSAGLIQDTDKLLNACVNLAQLSNSIGCNELDKIRLSSKLSSIGLISVCEQSYLTNQNDTCESISRTLEIDLTILKETIKCDNFTSGQILCIQNKKLPKSPVLTTTRTFKNENLTSESEDEEETVDDLDNFNQEGLIQHNYFRNLHKASPLELNKELIDFAQQWAESLAKIGHLKHSTREIGENLAMACGSSNYSSNSFCLD